MKDFYCSICSSITKAIYVQMYRIADKIHECPECKHCLYEKSFDKIKSSHAAFRMRQWYDKLKTKHCNFGCGISRHGVGLHTKYEMKHSNFCTEAQRLAGVKYPIRKQTKFSNTKKSITYGEANIKIKLIDESGTLIDELGTVKDPSVYDLKCDCGGEIARTLHVHWCSTLKEMK